jgi:hypothetical protein
MVGPLSTFLTGLGLVLGQAPPTQPATAPTPTVVPADTDYDPVVGPGPATADEPSRVYVQGEYLLWWIRNYNSNLFVTTGPITDQPPGALHQPGTQILFNGSGLAGGDRSGARVTAGFWIDEERSLAIEANFFFLGTEGKGFIVGPTSNEVVVRPFFNTLTGLNDGLPVAQAGGLFGKVSILANTVLQGFEINASKAVVERGNWQLSVLGGFRYLHLDESINVNSTTQVSPTFPVFTGDVIQVLDTFRTRNEFYGGQIGVRGEYQLGRADISLAVKLALGDSMETVQIRGSTLTQAPGGGAPNVQAGGLLALPSNSGSFNHDNFAVIPEVTLKIGYHITERLKGFIGYNFFADTAVERPASFINPNINPTQAPTNAVTGGTLVGAALPAFPGNRETVFWAQGFLAGFEWNF